MESAGFERLVSRYETGDDNFAQLMLDYVAAIFNTYTLSLFLDYYPYRIGRKNGLRVK